jgi:polysaccharide biosynthesis protein PslH
LLKILWVKSGGLVPPDTGGKIRSYQILRELSRRHQVTVGLFYNAEKNDRHADLKTQFRDVICWPVDAGDRSSWTARVAYAKKFLSLQPHSVFRFCRPEMLRDARGLVAREKFDLIVCDFVLAAPIIPWGADAPKILFAHNVEARIWRRHFDLARNPIWKAVWWREFWTTARMERKYARAAEHVITVSEADRTDFCKFTDASKVTAIPTGVDVDYFQPLPALEEPNSIVFTGSMNWLPNEDGIIFFAQKILPIIRQTIPNVVLWVVGRTPSPAVKKLGENDSSIRVTGAVEDVRPCMGRGSVYVCPLRVGGGTRLKIFEAMAMGKAIVSTTIGAEGLPVTHGKDLLLADEPGDFAERVIQLLRNESLRNQLGSSARNLVKQHYSWRRVAADCEAVFDRVVQEYAEGKAVKARSLDPVERISAAGSQPSYK